MKDADKIELLEKIMELSARIEDLEKISRENRTESCKNCNSHSENG